VSGPPDDHHRPFRCGRLPHMFDDIALHWAADWVRQDTSSWNVVDFGENRCPLSALETIADRRLSVKR
jgi:hypothetical protein